MREGLFIRGPISNAVTETRSRSSEGFVGPPGASGATHGISRPLWRTRPSVVSRVCPAWAIRGARTNDDDVVEDGLNTGEADGADGRGCRRREVHGERSHKLFGRLPGASMSAFGEEDPGGERGMSRGGGVARADFVRTVMGGLVTAPVIAGVLSGGGGQAAEAVSSILRIHLLYVCRVPKSGRGGGKIFFRRVVDVLLYCCLLRYSLLIRKDGSGMAERCRSCCSFVTQRDCYC